MKKDKGFTYLQDRFDIDRIESQIKSRKALFPEMLEHVEFIRDAGKVVSAGLSLLQFSTEDRLKELINYCEDNDIRVANPHTHYLDDDTRWYRDAFSKCKAEWDPYRLLNQAPTCARKGAPLTWRIENARVPVNLGLVKISVTGSEKSSEEDVFDAKGKLVLPSFAEHYIPISTRLILRYHIMKVDC